jgi:SNF2 family DNA or RNA helicase
VIVGCQFIHEAKRICDLVPGAVHASTVKNNLEDEWNSGRIPILVADPRSLGHGLNLQQGGRDIIWFSPTWSRELYDQFNARVARKGQEKVPRVHRLLSPQTIDEVVVESLREKGDGQNAMLRIMSNYQRIAGEEEE